MRYLLCAILMVVFNVSLVQAEEEAAEAGPKTHYIDVKPSIVVNFGSSGRLRFMRVLIALKVGSNKAQIMTERHLPYIRNALVMLLSEQTPESVGNAAGKELIRQTALERVQAVMKDVEGVSVVDDLFFKSFVVQS